MREKVMLRAAANGLRDPRTTTTEIHTDDQSEMDAEGEAWDGGRIPREQRLPMPTQKPLSIEIRQTQEPIDTVGGSSTAVSAMAAEVNAARRVRRREKRIQGLAAETEIDILEPAITRITPAMDSGANTARHRRKMEKRANKAANLSAHASVKGKKKEKRKRGEQAEDE